MNELLDAFEAIYGRRPREATGPPVTAAQQAADDRAEAKAEADTAFAGYTTDAECDAESRRVYGP